MLDLYDDPFQIGERSRESGCKAIRQQAEGATAFRTIPARNARAGRFNTLIGAMACEPAPAVRVQRTVIEGRTLPSLLADVILTGEGCLESQLQRMLARTAGNL